MYLSFPLFSVVSHCFFRPQKGLLYRAIPWTGCFSCMFSSFRPRSIPTSCADLKEGAGGGGADPAKYKFSMFIQYNYRKYASDPPPPVKLKYFLTPPPRKNVLNLSMSLIHVQWTIDLNQNQLTCNIWWGWLWRTSQSPGKYKTYDLHKVKIQKKALDQPRLDKILLKHYVLGGVVILTAC